MKVHIIKNINPGKIVIGTSGIIGGGALATINSQTNKNINKENNHLKILKYDDYGSWDNYIDSNFEEHASKREQANNVVTGIMLTNGFTGGVAGLFSAAATPLFAASLEAMTTKIGTIYGLNLGDAAVKGLSGLIGKTVVLGATSSLLGAIPIIGHIASGISSAYITKKIGNEIVNRFELAIAQANEQMELIEKMNKVMSENERLNKRNELINKILEEMAIKERNNK